VGLGASVAVKRTVLLALLLACGAAQAANWVSLGKSEDGTVEPFVDVSSIRIAGSIRRAWIKHVFIPHTFRGTGDDVNKWQSESLARIAFNCADESKRTEALTVYYDDGTGWSAPATAYPSPWEPVVPDTVRSTAMQFICAWGKK
jgi:hypothetical protein